MSWPEAFVIVGLSGWVALLIGEILWIKLQQDEGDDDH
jgi:hypothetical protein